MTEAIRNFILSLEAVLGFLAVHLANPFRNQMTLWWEDFENWLVSHQLTLPQFLGRILSVLVGINAFGILVIVWGVILGSFAQIGAITQFNVAFYVGLACVVVLLYNTLKTAKGLSATLLLSMIFLLAILAALTWTAAEVAQESFSDRLSYQHMARGIIFCGLLICWLGMVPFRLLANLSDKVASLLYRTGDFCAETLKLTGDNGVVISDNLRKQLIQLEDRKPLKKTIDGYYAALTGTVLLLLFYPSVFGLGGIILFVAAIGVLLAFYDMLGARGYGLQRATLSAVTAGLLAALAGGFILVLLDFFVGPKLYPSVTDRQTFDTVTWWVVFAIVMIIFFTSFIMAWPKMRIAKEEAAIRAGDVKVNGYELRPVIDHQTGKPCGYDDVRHAGASSSGSPAAAGNFVRTISLAIGVVAALVVIVSFAAMLLDINPFASFGTTPGAAVRTQGAFILTLLTMCFFGFLLYGIATSKSK